MTPQTLHFRIRRVVDSFKYSEAESMTPMEVGQDELRQ